METSSAITFQTLFFVGVSILQGLILFYLKNSKSDHNRINSEITELKTDIARLKVSNMTDSKVRSIMHEQLEPIVKSLEKFQDSQEQFQRDVRGEIKDISDNVIIGIKENIINLNAKQTFLKEQIDIQNGMKENGR